MSKPDYKYDKVDSVTLEHLPETELVISRMTGGPIPNEAKQYFINTHFKPDPNGAQIAFSKGFSIQLGQIPSICARLLAIYEKETKQIA